MKKLLLFLFISLGLISLSYAHSGRTDSKGGHWNHSSETYHYHSKSKSNKKTCDSIYCEDSYSSSFKPCSKHPEFARGINGMVHETKEQCLKRFKRQRENLFKRLYKEQLERDKNNSFIYFDWDLD
jgi:hypothetical protein